jgi:glyoxylate reductase
MPKPSILVTYKLPSAAIATLETVGEVEVPSAIISGEELLKRVKGKDALVVVDLMKIDKAVIDAAPDLKVIANVAVGYNNIDVAYARSKNVVVTNTPDVLTDATASAPRRLEGGTV